MTTTWEAVYSDGTSLKQFDDDKEFLFKDIQQEKLKEFRLFHQGRVISLFPETGTFGLNGLLYDSDISSESLQYRLIYFVRRKRSMGSGGQSQTGDTDTYFIGFQTTKDGENHKRILKLDGLMSRMVKE